MVSDLIRDARFILVFTGECPFVGIFDGWNALLAEIHEQYTVNDDEHAELIERLEDRDGWTIDTCRAKHLPYCYSEDTGEIGSMTIYRVTEDGTTDKTITVDGVDYHASGMTSGEQLRSIAKVPADRDLWLARLGDDSRMAESFSINIAGGERFYTAPKEI